MADPYENYQSPYSWRYGSPEMRRVWSEAHKRYTWRELWCVLAEVQGEFGLTTPSQTADLRAHQAQIDVPRALQIEAEIHHDLMAELKTFAEQAPLGGPILHLGATSMDIEDNADALRLRQALDILLPRVRTLLLRFAGRIEQSAHTPIMAFTHLQPAEPTTLGYRLASYAQDIWQDYAALLAARGGLRGKGFKGAVGTGAAYAELLGVENLPRFEARLSERLGLPFFPIATQVYPRRQEYTLISALAGLGGSLYKFAFDLRLLQSPPVGEWSEPFAARQVGSSAMPFKRNPIQAEKIDSLARALAGMPRLAWDNAAHCLLERTLDDSANRRSLLPESFLIADELLSAAQRLVDGLVIDHQAIARNLQAYGPFAALERVLMALAKAGADRQAMHEVLREHALAAWEALQNNRVNPLAQLLRQDPRLTEAYLSADEIDALMNIDEYVGDAPARALRLAQDLRAGV